MYLTIRYISSTEFLDCFDMPHISYYSKIHVFKSVEQMRSAQKYSFCLRKPLMDKMLKTGSRGTFFPQTQFVVRSSMSTFKHS